MTFGSVSSDQTLTRSIHLGISNWRGGATAPTAQTIGTTPTIEAQRFSATNELLSTFASLPSDMDRTQNATLRLQWSLAAAETDSDTLDITVDYTAVLANSTGDGVGRTSTQVTGQVTVTTANGLAAGDIYEMDITIASGDATNPLTSSVGLALEFHLTNTTGVASADFLDADLIYTALY